MTDVFIHRCHRAMFRVGSWICARRAYAVLVCLSFNFCISAFVFPFLLPRHVPREHLISGAAANTNSRRGYKPCTWIMESLAWVRNIKNLVRHWVRRSVLFLAQNCGMAKLAYGCMHRSDTHTHADRTGAADAWAQLFAHSKPWEIINEQRMQPWGGQQQQRKWVKSNKTNSMKCAQRAYGRVQRVQFTLYKLNAHICIDFFFVFLHRFFVWAHFARLSSICARSSLLLSWALALSTRRPSIVVVVVSISKSFAHTHTLSIAVMQCALESTTLPRICYWPKR